MAASRSLFADANARQNNHFVPLIEFRAGKIKVEGRMAVPDKRKGTLLLVKDPEEMMRVQWKDRANGTVEDDLIVFPEEATFRPTRNAPPRVYTLEFHTSNRKMLFWMQEPNAAGDPAILKRMNRFLSQGPDQMEEDEDESAAGAAAAQKGQGMDVDEPAAPQTTPTSAARRTASAGPVPASAAAPVATAAGTPSAPNDRAQQIAQAMAAGMANLRAQRDQAGLDLADVLKPDRVLPFLEDEETLQRLYQHVPEDQRNPHMLRELIRSPQFQNALDHLTYAARQGAVRDLLIQFGVKLGQDEVPLGVEALLWLIQRQVDEEAKATPK